MIIADAEITRYRSLRTRLTWTEACLWPVLLGHGALAVLQTAMVLRIADAGPSALPSWDAYEALTLALTALIVPFALGAVLTFVRWQRQAARNLYQLTDEPVKYDIGWATWGWFLPFANLIVPMRFFLEQSRKSSGDREEVDLTPLVTLWWCLFLGSQVLDAISSRLAESSELDTLLTALGFGIVGAGGSVLAGFYVIVLLRHITRRQDVTWAELSGASAG